MYEVVTCDSWITIASGFESEGDAWAWVYDHDYGQFELEGGVMVIQYE